MDLSIIELIGNNMANRNVLDILKARGYIEQVTDESSLRELLETPQVFYQGFDPSSDSFHFGTLESLMVMHILQEHGHKVIFLLGGGTGRVGDPTGKSTTRNQLTHEIVENNAINLQKQVENIGLVKFSGDNGAVMLNNDTWLRTFSFLEDFLMKIARHFSVNTMVKQTTFSTRLAEEKPLSLLEFCYPVLQGWDFLWLYDNENCKIQIGGNDQWTNILQGVELIRKEHEGAQAFAVTLPLILTPDGNKMGKSEKGAVWLDPSKTSPYDFYQYILKLPDESLRQMFLLFTFLPETEIDEIVKNPHEAQKRLAYQITSIVHGEEEARKAAASESVPEITLKAGGEQLIDLLVNSGCVSSKSEVRRLVNQGGVSLVNGEKIDDPAFVITTPTDIKYGKGKLLRVL